MSCKLPRPSQWRTASSRPTPAGLNGRGSVPVWERSDTALISQPLLTAVARRHLLKGIAYWPELLPAS